MKKILGVIFSIGVVAAIVVVAINHKNYRSMLPQSTKPAVVAAKSVAPQPTDSLGGATTDTLTTTAEVAEQTAKSDDSQE